MKIVVNRCFGSFGLSKIAVKEYLKLKNKEVFFYKHPQNSYKTDYKRCVKDSREAEYQYCLIKDLGEEIDKADIHESCYFYHEDVKRDDIDLVIIVEKLGKLANGECASLEVVTIPDDVEWEIWSHQGEETIHECHRVW